MSNILIMHPDGTRARLVCIPETPSQPYLTSDEELMLAMDREIESLRAQLAEAEGDRDTWHATSDRDLVKTMAADAKLRAVREIYAGMEGFIPQTAPEGYCLRIIREMYEAVKEPK